jgi:hypothetical protein
VLWKKIMVLDAINGASQAWSSMNPGMLVRSWRKLLPDPDDDDLQGFPNEETSKSKILDILCAMRSFENINKKKKKVKELLQSDVCVKWASSTRQTDRHCQCCRETEGRRREWEG